VEVVYQITGGIGDQQLVVMVVIGCDGGDWLWWWWLVVMVVIGCDGGDWRWSV